MEEPNGQKVIERRRQRTIKLIKELHRKGYSYRQIMRRLGFKSPATILYYLKGRQTKSLKKNGY